MSRLALVSLFLSALLLAQQGPVKKSPETIKAELDTEVIRARLDLAASQRRLAQLQQTLEMRKLEAEAMLRAARADAAAAPAEAEKGRLAIEAALANAKSAVASADKDRARAELEVEARLANAQVSVEYAKVASVAQIAKLQQKAADIASHAQLAYPKDPLIDGVLHISDRRIPFNGRVDDKLAAFVCGRIAFYNALDDEAPIFIVIDRSPGGSVMSGYMMLQAMETSKAPVFVVVKGYAASMAAIITTMAKRSFVYPQTIVLHHQASSGLSGNVTQLKEQLKWSKVWVERIFVKVAFRAGVSVEDFVAQMYKSVSTGDWKVTGDDAARLHWVTNVVERMTEDSFFSAGAEPKPTEIMPEGFVDAGQTRDGRPRLALPPLGPCDVWWLFDPTVEYVLR
jgi:ATP-dependent Clp protease protease subunit